MVYGCMGVWVYGCMGAWMYGCTGCMCALDFGHVYGQAIPPSLRRVRLPLIPNPNPNPNPNPSLRRVRLALIEVSPRLSTFSRTPGMFRAFMHPCIH